MLFLLGCRRGSLARDQRHLPVARPTEVLILIFLGAAATSCFLRRSSDRDVLESLSACVIWRKISNSSFRGIHGGFYSTLFAALPYTCCDAPSKQDRARSMRVKVASTVWFAHVRSVFHNFPGIIGEITVKLFTSEETSWKPHRLTSFNIVSDLRNNQMSIYIASWRIMISKCWHAIECSWSSGRGLALARHAKSHDGDRG